MKRNSYSKNKKSKKGGIFRSIGIIIIIFLLWLGFSSFKKEPVASGNPVMGVDTDGNDVFLDSGNVDGLTGSDWSKLTSTERARIYIDWVNARGGNHNTFEWREKFVLENGFSLEEYSDHETNLDWAHWISGGEICGEC